MQSKLYQDNIGKEYFIITDSLIIFLGDIVTKEEVINWQKIAENKNKEEIIKIWKEERDGDYIEIWRKEDLNISLLESVSVKIN